jgi:hypothetical protein
LLHLYRVDLTPKEACHLLVLLHEWDLTGSTRHSLTDVYAALQLLKLAKVPFGGLPAAALPDRPDSRQSTTSTSLTSCSAATQPTAAAAAAAAAGTFSAGREKTVGRQQGRAGANVSRRSNGVGADVAGSLAGGMASLKEAYLSERVAALEAELAHARSSSGTVSNEQVIYKTCVLHLCMAYILMRVHAVCATSALQLWHNSTCLCGLNSCC